MSVRSEKCWLCLFGSYATCVIQTVCPGGGKGEGYVNVYEDINKCICSYRTVFIYVDWYICYISI